jgi:3-methyladenine DNA glycosylase AlkD
MLDTALDPLLRDIDAVADPTTATALERYFQVRPGGYGEGDHFVGVRVPRVRALVRPYRNADITTGDFDAALASPTHEHRLAALILMAAHAASALERGDSRARRELAECYLRNTSRVNNWDLVDTSAPDVLGGWLLDRPRDLLTTLVRSASVWERRIALISTYRFIRAGQIGDTLTLAELVLDDPHDLVHKAAGWMLREAGKRVDQAALLQFLDANAARMPRTMLRYSIERLSPEQRRHYRQLA